MARNLCTQSQTSTVMQLCKPQKSLRCSRSSRRFCQQQHDKNQLKILRASFQYMYDNTNAEYLDCINSVSHVGHCHPSVVEAVSSIMEESSVSPCGWEMDQEDLIYPKKLHELLPEHLDTLFFCNSGSEAVDLAVQLSRLYTCGTDAIVVDNAFHGSLDSVHQLSPKVSKANNISKADWVHVVTMPDLYCGPYQRDDPCAVDRYLADARHMIDQAQLAGRKIACFLAEPMLTVPGCIIPPSSWLQKMYRMVQEFGGLCIADEVQTSLGRVGSHLWSFQAQGVTPDIVIVGKSVGNGYPMASVVTSRDIAAVLGPRRKEYLCTKEMDAVGCAVLDVLSQHQLMHSAAVVGAFLKDLLVRLQSKHDNIGDVRGRGLMLGVEIVWSKQSKKPAREIAQHVVRRMKEEYIIIANEGNNKNILMMMPPMCFTQENALLLSQKLDKVLSEIPSLRLSGDHVAELPTTTISEGPSVGWCEGRLGIVQPQEEEDDDGFSASQENLDLPDEQHNYQDLD